MRTFRVREAYDAAYPDPLVVEKGDRLVFERRPSEWSGWIWCTDAGGKGGWVPEAWVAIDGARCTMTRDYSARELTVGAGDVLKASMEVSGWVWCIGRRGDAGWVPLDHLEPTT